MLFAAFVIELTTAKCLTLLLNKGFNKSVAQQNKGSGLVFPGWSSLKCNTDHQMQWDQKRVQGIGLWIKTRWERVRTRGLKYKNFDSKRSAKSIENWIVNKNNKH